MAGTSAVNQTPIGKRYLITGLCFFLLGGVMALLMRTQLAVPENDFIGYELYNQLFTMHGTTMLFLFAVPILEGAAVFLLPPMIGARDMAFPRLSAFGYWCYLFGGILLYSSILFGMMPDAGWTIYTPLSGPTYSPGKGIDFWLIGITLVETGTVVAAAEIAVSILKSRAPGMSLNRMPLFAWYMLVVSFMILVGFPPLIMGDFLLELERSFNWPFFDVERGGHDLLWQHLFWIFGHPEVYIIFLPAAGFVSMMVSTFAQRPVVGHYWLVAAAVGTGFVSFGLWVHHMFATGIPMISLGWFSAASMTVAIFSGIQVFAWLATIWSGKPILRTPMLFVAGFIFIFVVGGLSGVMHAAVPFDWQTHSSYFLVAHFHYVLIGGMLFPLFGAIYYWYPLTTGRLMSERLGKWHFWLLFIGFNVSFFPMHIAGLKGMPRRIYTYSDGMWEWENFISTSGTYVMAVAILLFLFNFFRSRHRGALSGANPWNAGSLEWAMPLPSPPYNFRSIPRIEHLYPMWRQDSLAEKSERGEFYLSDAIGGLRLGVSTHAVTGELEDVVIQPKPDFSPLLTAIGLATLFVGFLVKWYWLSAVGAAAFLLALLYWLWRMPYLNERVWKRIEEETHVPIGGEASHNFGWWGTIIGLVGDASLFVSLVFAFLYLGTVNTDWPPWRMQDVGLALPTVSLVLLLFGSGTLHVISRDDQSKSRILTGLALAGVLGSASAALHTWLLLESSLSPQLHAYNAMVYVMVAFAVFHVAAAVLMLLYCIAQRLFGNADLVFRHALRNTCIVWHYVVAVSVITTLLTYFWQALVQ